MYFTYSFHFDVSPPLLQLPVLRSAFLKVFPLNLFCLESAAGTELLLAVGVRVQGLQDDEKVCNRYKSLQQYLDSQVHALLNHVIPIPQDSSIKNER